MDVVNFNEEKNYEEVFELKNEDIFINNLKEL